MKNNKKWLVPGIIIIVLLVVIIVIMTRKSGEPVVIVPPSPASQVSPTTESAPTTQPVTTEETTSTTQPSQPGKPTTTTLQQKAISCNTTQCLGPYFLKCTPAELKMPFGDNAFLVITVFGIENGKCHYVAKVVDSSGKAIPAGPPTTECFMPVDKITTATFNHLFGGDTATGQETVKAEQDKLFADYCSQK